MHVAPRAAASTWSSRASPDEVRRRRPRRAAGPGRDARLHARAARLRPAGAVLRGRGAASRCSASASACRCCSTTARKAADTPGLGLIPGEVHALPTSRAGCSPTAAAQGAADGLEPRAARRGRTRCGTACPTAAASISCTATTPDPSDARHSAGETDYGDALYLRRWHAIIFSPRSSTPRRAPTTAGAVPQLPPLEPLTRLLQRPRAVHPVTSPAMLLIPAIDLKDGHCVRLQARRHGPAPPPSAKTRPRWRAAG